MPFTFEKPTRIQQEDKEFVKLKKEFTDISLNPKVECYSHYSSYSPLCPSSSTADIIKLMNKKLDRFIYLDNNATHPMIEPVKEKMKEMFNLIGNPSSRHLAGERVKAYIEAARTNIANHIGTDDPSRLFFTASGSESNNTFIKGVAFKNIGSYRDTIITTRLEHYAVIRPIKYLEKFGFKIIYIDVDKNGLIDTEDLKSKLNDKTLLVSIMATNNETGTVYPIHEYYKIIKNNSDALFHCDMSQAFGKIQNVKVGDLDAVTITGHKFGGPIGISILYVKDKDLFDPLIHGGNQEFNKRAGTYNPINISALNIAFEELKDIDYNKIQKLRDWLDDRIVERFSCSINCKEVDRMVNTTSITFSNIIGDELIDFLSNEGIFISSSSACSSHEKKPSHVLKAIGLSDEEAYRTIRVSLNRDNTKKELEFFINKVTEFIER